jgi:predicted RecA/RadA family phage recombinase
MRSAVQRGNIITLVAPYDVKAGEGLLVGEIFGIATADAAAGTPLECDVVGVTDIVCQDGDTGTPGMPAYWDDDNRWITVGGGTPVGHLVATKTAGSPTARVLMSGPGSSGFTADEVAAIRARLNASLSPGIGVAIDDNGSGALTLSALIAGTPQKDTVAIANAVALTTAVKADVSVGGTGNGIVLQPGTYLIFGTICFNGTATAVTYAAGWITTSTGAALPTGDLRTTWLGRGAALPADSTYPVPLQVITVTVATNLRLCAQASFTGGTCLAYGSLSALRLA